MHVHMKPTAALLALLLAACAGTDVVPDDLQVPPGVRATARTALRVESADGRCSGVALDDGRTVATAAHCMPADPATLRVIDMNGVTARATCERPSESHDIVVCTTDGTAFEPLTRAPRVDVRTAEPLYSIGFGCTRMPQLHTGVLLYAADGRWLGSMYPPACGGDSGGPVLDAQGRVFGIVTGGNPHGMVRGELLP